MKTRNLTPWCNIYYSALKYNISITHSRYKTALIAFVALVFISLLAIQLTTHYSLVLVVNVLFWLVLGTHLRPDKKQQGEYLQHFQLSHHGLIEYKGETQDECSYQLLPQSRCSFLGAWLVMQGVNQSLDDNSTCSSNNRLALTKKQQGFGKKHNLFLFRDSFTQQGFSHLARVIKSLS
ncbi:protein YgfX [Litorilituus lipolyticus]|uniref:Uncharacterized protein n=1 Tax=Litorilituus lipolyticus TaxID=2491017 RepID=A0A502KXQ8_9GAMM|nr:protein YgfX [Litorilituus lipolyticus]TPH16560.1 hypothetical protein EPA86_06185 [Litorilituus lipolyticus]